MAVATVDLKRGEVVGAPQIVTRGWAYDQDTEALLDEARAQVTKALEQALAAGQQRPRDPQPGGPQGPRQAGRGPDPPAPDDRPGHRHRLKPGPGPWRTARRARLRLARASPWSRRCGTTLLPTVTTATKRPAGRSGASRPKGQALVFGPVAPPRTSTATKRGRPTGGRVRPAPGRRGAEQRAGLLASMGAVIAGHATDLWGVVLVTVGVLAALAFYADSLGPAGHDARLGFGDLLGWGRFLVPPVAIAVGLLLVIGRRRRGRRPAPPRSRPGR